MRFTLTYEGSLKASGNKPKPKEVWQIRRVFHPQLHELWLVHPVLKNLYITAQVPKTGAAIHIERYDEETTIPPLQGGGSSSDRINLVAPIRRNGIEFIPLVRKSLHLACGLRIIFLRKEEP
jgi:hypothetical protein